MFKQIFPFFSHSRKLWLYGLLSVITAISISMATPQMSYALSWRSLILNGVQAFQLSNMSNSQEISLGKQINEELVQVNKIKIYQNPAIVQYVNQIGQAMAKNSSRPDLKYTFQVVEDKNINAFATMGGYVYVNTGLLAIADNEGEVASVIGHEIGHIAGRHAIKQMRQQAITQGLLSAAGLDRSAAVQIGVDLALNKPNSRQDEIEADTLGLAMIKKARYAPATMVSFMQKLLKASGGSSMPAFLSTHPATKDRITALQAQIAPNTANNGNGLNSQDYKNHIRTLVP